MKINKETKVEDFALFYLERKKNYIKESTYAIYTAITINKINFYFKSIKLKHLNSNSIQEFANFLITYEYEKEKTLSFQTCRQIISYFKTVMEYLFKLGIIDVFDLDYKITNNVKIKKIHFFNELDIIKLRDYLKQSSDIRSLGILICMFSGIRIGELCALKWSDIDEIQKTINVSKTLQRISIKNPDLTTESKIIITTPKSNKSIRNIPLHSELISRTTENIRLTGYILTNSDIPLEPREIRYYYSSILKKLSIEHKSFHSLRHTFATRLIKNTNDFKTVSELLGHSSISTTLDIYTYTSEETKINCINKY